MNTIEYRIWDRLSQSYFPPKYYLNLCLKPDGNVMWFSTETGFEDITQNVIVQFCIGIRDKNKIKIFEGDILENGFTGEDFKRYYVKWPDNEHCLCAWQNIMAGEDATIGDVFLNKDLQNSVIVGNVCENKGLLVI